MIPRFLVFSGVFAALITHALLPVFVFYNFGAAQHLGYLNLLYVYFLGAVILIPAAVIVIGITLSQIIWRRLPMMQCGLLRAAVSVLFLILLVLGARLQRDAFCLGAANRIDSLGGAEFVKKLKDESIAAAASIDSQGGEVPANRVSELFRQIGCRSAYVITTQKSFTLVVDVSGAFFPSSWMIAPDDHPDTTGYRVFKIYPGLYRAME